MEEPNQEKSTALEKTTSLSWPARIFFSLFSSIGIGLALGSLLSMRAKGVDGEAGYAALVYIPTMIFFAFLALIFITNKRIHIIFAVISALIWGLIFINKL
jgi:hypothetical protein